MIRDAQEIQSLALKYSKPQLAHMAQIGLIDTQKAVLAAMMRDRISKEDAKPPTTTVAQDVLGMVPQQIAPPSEPPQMGMAQAPAPVMPEQMAATGGLTSIPIESQDYAGGGIVAFADGGVPRYAGDSQFGSLVGGSSMLPPQSAENANIFKQMEESDQERKAEQEARAATYIQTIREKQAQGLPLNRLEQMTLERAGQSTPINMALPNYGVTKQEGSQSFGTPTQFIDATKKQPLPELGTKNLGGAPKAPAMPASPLPAIGRYKMAAIEEQKMPENETIQQAIARQEEAEKAAGVDTGIFEKLRGEYEGKKGKVNERKQEAIGMAIMQTGLGLMGAAKGREMAALGESGQKALAGLVSTNEKIRDYEDRLEDKQRELYIAENDYKRSKSKAGLDRVTSLENKRNELENKAVDARNKREETIATIATQERGQDITARGQDLQYKAHMAQIGQMARPGETERLMAQYQALYKESPESAAKWLENLGTIRGIGKPQNTFSFEEAMKIVAAKPLNTNASPEELAKQARALMATSNAPSLAPNSALPKGWSVETH